MGSWVGARVSDFFITKYPNLTNFFFFFWGGGRGWRWRGGEAR